MRSSSLLLAAALTGLLLPLPLGLHTAHADGANSRPDTMPVSEIHAGMKGYGLTVFSGTKPERFDVEVIDVLKNFRPKQDLILIKTKHPRLEITKVVAGMSGSPIYLNDKMIGAYAYGWSFGSEPVAGVTPIANMLNELARPLPNSIDGWPLRLMPEAANAGNGDKPARHALNDFGERYRGDLAKYDLREHAAQIARSLGATDMHGPSALTPVSTPILLGGMSQRSVAFAQEMLSPLGLEPLQAGGAGAQDPNAPTRFVDGGAIGVQLIRGDMSAMGLGTVTRVEGDKLVAFGHPMSELGVTALPTAIGRVIWFLASDQRSFKIGMAVRDVGTLVNDRQSAIVVSQTAKAPVIPVKVSIHGAPGFSSSSWNFEVAHDRFQTPSFAAVALGSALQEVANEHQDVSWTATSVLKIKGFPDLTVQDYGVSMGGTPEAGEFARSNLIRAMGAILNNPWQPAIIESATMDVQLHYARDILRLRGAELLEPEIDAGQPARVRLTLVPFSGPEITRVVSVPIPAHLAGQTVNLEIEPGYTEDRDQSAPDTLAEMIKNFQDPVYPAKSLVVTFNTGDAGVTFKGHIAKDLPPGALDAIRPETSSVSPETFQTSTRIVVDLPEFMVGRDRVAVTVRPVLR
ncbi:MAG TPA: SpoIVB peptidase S55 domain-containing protein [Polyangiaceae bacterium]|nr:SpoIVB peptidase S55 domain-containing protein [Polyangiaceae bacterium]